MEDTRSKRNVSNFYNSLVPVDESFFFAEGLAFPISFISVKRAKKGLLCRGYATMVCLPCLPLPCKIKNAKPFLLLLFLGPAAFSNLFLYDRSGRVTVVSKCFRDFQGGSDVPHRFNSPLYNALAMTKLSTAHRRKK